MKSFERELSNSIEESDEETVVSLLDVLSVDPLDADRSNNGLLNDSGDMGRGCCLSSRTFGKSKEPASIGGVAFSTKGVKSLVRGDSCAAFLEPLPRPYFLILIAVAVRGRLSKPSSEDGSDRAEVWRLPRSGRGKYCA